MHRAGVDNLVRLQESRISFQIHAALGTTGRRFALHAFTHRAEVFLSRLTRIRESDACDLIVTIMAATGMCGRITVSVSFHSLTVRAQGEVSRSAYDGRGRDRRPKQRFSVL